MDATRALAALKRAPQYRDQIVHEEAFPARTAQFGELSRPLSDAVATALRRRGVTRLYTHQADAIEAVRTGASVIVTTGTASGKTLCYALPVLEALTEDPTARALFLYPTKALARDQADALDEFELPVRIGTYDGDTPAEARRRMRAEGQILLTNPDMLHVGILPQHFRWTPFLRALRYVVLDDMHVYRGVFGSHVALVLRRLRRLCRLRGVEPQFICTSATIANPGEFGERLTGVPLRVIDSDGAPRGPKRFVLWNPPVTDRARMGRRSPYTEASWLMAALLRREIRTIAFAKARKITELIYRYVADALADAPALAARVRPYRAGYLPAERRDIERRLFDGDLIGVVSTSALELGIDVGGLDAAVLVGYPGTMASVWQRAGRAGRGRGRVPCRPDRARGRARPVPDAGARVFLRPARRARGGAARQSLRARRAPSVRRLRNRAVAGRRDAVRPADARGGGCLGVARRPRASRRAVARTVAVVPVAIGGYPVGVGRPLPDRARADAAAARYRGSGTGV